MLTTRRIEEENPAIDDKRIDELPIKYKKVQDIIGGNELPNKLNRGHRTADLVSRVDRSWDDEKHDPASTSAPTHATGKARNP